MAKKANTNNAFSSKIKCPKCGGTKVIVYTNSIECLKCGEFEKKDIEDFENKKIAKDELLTIKDKMAFIDVFDDIFGDFKD